MASDIEAFVNRRGEAIFKDIGYSKYLEPEYGTLENKSVILINQNIYPEFAFLFYEVIVKVKYSVWEFSADPEETGSDYICELDLTVKSKVCIELDPELNFGYVKTAALELIEITENYEQDAA